MINFQSLCYHFEKYGCTIDHLYEDAHMVTNFVAGQVCIVEKHSSYTDIGICHYCYELKIPPPEELFEVMAVYKDKFREVLLKKIPE